MKKVLLTGASGFVGWHCIDPLLTCGYEVHAVSRQQVSASKTAELVWHTADLFDSAALKRLLEEVRPTHLLHCAWDTTPRTYWTSPDNFLWVRTTLELLEKFVAKGGKRAVGVGSCAEYDWRYGFCSESGTPLNPTTTYGICKHFVQQAFDRFGKASNLSVAWARLFFLYGPQENQERLVASMIRSLLKGETAQCTHGEQIRDYLYIKDAGSALVALLDSQVEGAVNIGSGTPTTLKEIITDIGEQLNQPGLIQFGARATADDDPPLLLADIGRLKDEIGWTPRYDRATGLAETIDWWKAQTKNE